MCGWGWGTVNLVMAKIILCGLVVVVKFYIFASSTCGA